MTYHNQKVHLILELFISKWSIIIRTRYLIKLAAGIENNETHRLPPYSSDSQRKKAYRVSPQYVHTPTLIRCAEFLEIK